MNISDIQRCADFFQEHYLKTFYLVITYDGKSFILIGEKTNFPHLMGFKIALINQMVTTDHNISSMISLAEILSVRL